MRNQLSHTVGMYAIGFVMCGSYEIALHTGLLSATDDEILLLSLPISQVENVQRCLPTLLYIPLWRMKFKAITFVNVT